MMPEPVPRGTSSAFTRNGSERIAMVVMCTTAVERAENSAMVDFSRSDRSARGMTGKGRPVAAARWMGCAGPNCCSRCETRTER